MTGKKNSQLIFKYDNQPWTEEEIEKIKQIVEKKAKLCQESDFYAAEAIWEIIT